TFAPQVGTPNRAAWLRMSAGEIAGRIAMLALEKLRTPRLLLRRFGPEDFDDLTRMHSDPVVMATLGGLRTPAVHQAAFDRHMAHWQRYGFGWWVVRDPDTLRLIGRGGVRWMTLEGREEMEVGYGLVAECWGRGLATE